MRPALFGVSCLSVFVLFRCGGARELQTNVDELEGLLMQAASAQTADPVEDAKQAVPPRVLLLRYFACSLCLLGHVRRMRLRGLGLLLVKHILAQRSTPVLGRNLAQPNDFEICP